jgi:SAM-dependent methyltransferase
MSPPVVALVCPRCRRPPQGWPLLTDSLQCSNPECGHGFTTLAGTDIALVVRGDPAPFLAMDATVDFADRDGIDRWLGSLAPGSAEWEAAVRIGMYAVAHHGQSQTLFTQLHERFVEALPIDIETVVDLGCGVGGFAAAVGSRIDAAVLGIDASGLALRVAAAGGGGHDLYLPMLEDGVRLTSRRVQGPFSGRAGRIGWLCADVHDPSVVPGAFDLVVAVNLFDSVADPAIALGQAAALVRPGGYLLVCQPEAWNAVATPPANWFAPSEAAWDERLQHLGLEVVDREDGFEWELVRTPRHRTHYIGAARLARRVGTV